MSTETIFLHNELRLKTPRAAGIAGILAGSLFFTSHFLILVSFPENTAGSNAGPQNQLWLASIALQLLPFAGIAFIWFMGVIRDRLGQWEDRFYATVFLGSGLLYLAMIFTATALAAGLGSLYSVSPPELAWIAATVGWSLVTQITNIFGLRMASVFMLSSATMWLRTQVMPRWLAALSALLALILLFASTLSPWLTLLFPVWILTVSIMILISNLRHITGAKTD
jgi:hypothetical protein